MAMNFLAASRTRIAMLERRFTSRDRCTYWYCCGPNFTVCWSAACQVRLRKQQFCGWFWAPALMRSSGILRSVWR